MSARAPHLLLLALLALAAAIFLGGSRLARREERVRLERDRTPVRDFSGALQKEIHRLESQYEGHLRRIARSLTTLESAEIRQSADGVVGIRQLSILQDGRPNNLHVILDGTRDGKLPEPSFVAPARGGLPRPTLLIPVEQVFGTAEDHGWVEQPELLYWFRRAPKEVVVFLLHREILADILDTELKTWATRSFAPVMVRGGPDHFLDHAGHILAATTEPPSTSRPDFLLPIPARFGTWQLASWDRMNTMTHYDIPTLTASAVAAGVIALVAVIAFIQQRRAYQLAAQRVSFVNRVSHELRTPLTNIQLNADLAADASADPEVTRRLALVQEESRRLGRLIANVLTFSQREKGPIPAQARACQPDHILSDVLAQFEASFGRRAITVSRCGEASAACVIDADALAQIIANLLSNVEKYAPGSAVEIAAQITKGHLTVRVADTGPGIPAREAARIFRPFERLSSHVTEGVTGAGLGLTIARELATRMGGSLQLLPSQGGATFEIRIPAPTVPAPHAADASG